MRSKYFEHQHVFNEIELETETVDDQRYYKIPTGERYKSVTTVLSKLNSNQIAEWRNRVGHDVAQKISTQASRRGTALHKVVEDYLKNDDNFLDEHTPASIDLFSSIKDILDKRVEIVYGQEFCLFSHHLKTAGRCDLFCKFDGLNTVVDIKSSSKQKRHEWIENYFIQATTYAIMIAERHNINVPTIAIVIGVENGRPQVFVERVKDWVWKTREVFISS